MKKLSKLKLREFHEMDSHEMKVIVGGGSSSGTCGGNTTCSGTCGGTYTINWGTNSYGKVYSESVYSALTCKLETTLDPQNPRCMCL